MSLLFKHRLSRRAVLRAGAVLIGLPLLDAMQPLTAAGSSSQVPKRLVILQRPLGTYAPYFFPETAGPKHETTRFLKWIESHRGQYTVFSGLSHLGYPNTHGSEFGLLTGVHPDGIKRPEDIHNTISLDQAAAQKLGGKTRVPFLLLGDMGAGLSYTAHGVALPGERRRSAVFSQLFIDGSAAEVAQQVRNLNDGQSILDEVREQLRSLNREVGVADRQRLDVLATSIRQAEQSLAQDKVWAAQPKPKIAVSFEQDANEWVGQTRQWFDLIHLACQTDSTRVIVHRIPEQPAAPTAPGTTLGEHDASHHGKDALKVEQVALFEDAHFKLFDHLFNKLSSTPDQHGTLLDNTQVLCVSNLGDGSAHASSNLPILLAGGGYRHVGHIAFDRQRNYPLSNLYVRILRQMGIEQQAFGCSAGTLTELG